MKRGTRLPPWTADPNPSSFWKPLSCPLPGGQPPSGSGTERLPHSCLPGQAETGQTGASGVGAGPGRGPVPPTHSCRQGRGALGLAPQADTSREPSEESGPGLSLLTGAKKCSPEPEDGTVGRAPAWHGPSPVQIPNAPDGLPSTTRSGPLAQQAVVQNNPQNVSTQLGAASVKAAGGCWRSPWHSPETTGGGGVRGGPARQLREPGREEHQLGDCQPPPGPGAAGIPGTPGQPAPGQRPSTQPCLCLSHDSPCRLCHPLAVPVGHPLTLSYPLPLLRHCLVTLSLWPPRATSPWPHYALVPHVAGTVTSSGPVAPGRLQMGTSTARNRLSLT